MPNCHWEAHDYPQHTGCKQWLRPCGKSSVQQQFWCFMARKKYKASAVTPLRDADGQSSKDPTGIAQMTWPQVASKKGPQSRACGFLGCSLLPFPLQREKEKQWPVPRGTGSHPTAPAPRHFNHSHCIQENTQLLNDCWPCSFLSRALHKGLSLLHS